MIPAVHRSVDGMLPGRNGGLRIGNGVDGTSGPGDDGPDSGPPAGRPSNPGKGWIT